MSPVPDEPCQCILDLRFLIVVERLGALSKLERNIQRDRDDVKYLARTVPLDLEVLKQRYQKELRWQLGNPEREDLTLKLWIDAIEEEKRP